MQRNANKHAFINKLKHRFLKNYINTQNKTSTMKHLEAICIVTSQMIYGSVTTLNQHTQMTLFAMYLSIQSVSLGTKRVNTNHPVMIIIQSCRRTGVEGKYAEEDGINNCEDTHVAQTHTRISISITSKTFLKVLSILLQELIPN